MTDQAQKPRLFDTPFDHLDPQEAHRLKSEVMRVVGVRPLLTRVVAVRSVGVIGDHPSYDPTLVLVPVEGFACDSTKMGALATRIINEVKGIGRVMLDITPPKNNEGGSS